MHCNFVCEVIDEATVILINALSTGHPTVYDEGQDWHCQTPQAIYSASAKEY